MDNEKPTQWQYSQFLAGKIYYDWIQKKGLIELLLRPETIPSLFYQKNWDSKTQDIVEGILRFLQSLSILQEAGGTYTMHDSYSAKINQIEQKLEEVNSDHPTFQFIKYGLKLLDYKLDGDAGVWDIARKNYLLEIGLTQSAFEEFCALDKHLVTMDWKFKPIDEPKILIFANFISNTLHSLVVKTGKKRDITILTHDLIHKDRAITYCELERNTSKISNKIFALEEFEPNVKFDLIIIPNSLGFNRTAKENFTLLKNYSKSSTILYLYAPTEAKFSVGIDPINYVHPHFKGIPNTREFSRQAKAAGWSQSLRVGSNKEILLLKQG